MQDCKIVVFWRSGGEPARALTQKLPQIAFVFVDSEEELAGAIASSQALITSGIEYSPSMLQILREHGDRLRWIQATSAGIDKFLDCGLPEGVAFSRGGGLWDKPVAEHAMAMILTFARRILEIDRRQRCREWSKWSIDAATTSLEGKTIGILGYGGVGQELARKAKAFDMEVWGLRRGESPGHDPMLDMTLGPEDLPTLLKGADYLVVSLPLTRQTYQLIGAAELRLMKGNAILINIARGGVVDEQALVQALSEGCIAGAGLDVFEQEPIPANHPFWAMENVIVSPHVAGATQLRVAKVLNLLENNIMRFLDGRPLLHRVDLDAGY